MYEGRPKRKVSRRALLFRRVFRLYVNFSEYYSSETRGNGVTRSRCVPKRCGSFRDWRTEARGDGRRWTVGASRQTGPWRKLKKRPSEHTGRPYFGIGIRMLRVVCSWDAVVNELFSNIFIVLVLKYFDSYYFSKKIFFFVGECL